MTLFVRAKFAIPQEFIFAVKVVPNLYLHQLNWLISATDMSLPLFSIMNEQQTFSLLKYGLSQLLFASKMFIK